MSVSFGITCDLWEKSPGAGKLPAPRAFLSEMSLYLTQPREQKPHYIKPFFSHSTSPEGKEGRVWLVPDQRLSR